MPMKTIEGYSKEKYTNTSVLLAGGGAKALSDFIGSISWDSTNKKIKYTPVGGSATDLVTLSWDNIANKPTSLPANGGNADTAINLMPENTAHYFRAPNNSAWRGGMIWGSAGSESMSFVVANSGTRFQFVGGSDIASWTSSTWQSANPYLTIYSNGIVTPGSATASEGFIKSGYNDDYVLLAGGGHKAISDFSMAHSHPYLPLSGGTMTGALTVKQYIFGYNYNHAGNNAPAFVFDKPGSNYTGIGANGEADTIYFSAATFSNGEASWVTSYKQKWKFNGTIYQENNAVIHSGNIGSQSVDYANSAGNADILKRNVGNIQANDRGSADYTDALYTGGWASSSLGYATTYGTFIDLSGYSTWYHRLAFNTNGVIEHFMGINTTTLSKVGNLAYTSDIPSVGNGTVTITQAGSTIGSFTMNQSDNTIIDLNGTNTDYYPIRSYTSGLQISSYSGSTDCALFVPYATANQAGVVSTEDQTFSGEKTFSSIRLRSTDTVNFGGYLYFGDGSYTYLAELADDQLTLNATKIFLGISGSQKYYIDGTIFRPVTANSTSSSGIALGSSDYRFTCGYFSDKVYAYKGFYESSDERLKNILNPVKVNLDDLSKLRKVYYLWKDRTEDEIQLGMIAQDVQKLYPELVNVDKETGYLSLAYDKLSVLALEAIDVLYKEHKKLKKHVDELEKLLINNKIY